MKDFIKKNYRYLLIFLFVFFTYYTVITPSTYQDPFANYGFSHAIIHGELPYVDFNLISTPLYAYLMSIGLLIKDHFLTFLIENTILVTIMFYFLYELYENKIYVLLFIIALLIGDIICPTYNLLTLFFFVIIVFLEKKHSEKDILIGSAIACAFLSKHTIGAFFIVPSIVFFIKDKKKLINRFIGFIIPNIIFLIYLLITKSFKSFLDLCILGLFDFASNNGRVNSIWAIISFILLILSIVITLKDKKNILNIYFITTITFAIPLFDFAHFSLYFFCISMMVLQYISISNKKISYIFIIITIIYSSFVSYNMNKVTNSIIVKDIKRFNYLLMPNDSYHNSKKYFKYLNKYESNILLGYSKMFYDISNDRFIDYYDVLLYGNHGYNGTNKIIEKIKNSHDVYYIVDSQTYEITSNVVSQYNREIVDYVTSHCELVESKYIFDVYYKK